jgi:hypothetical protein
MRHSLRSVAARVERLADVARLDACDGQHAHVKISHIRDDEPAPDWPDPDAPAACRCGQPMTYSHVVHRLVP